MRHVLFLCFLLGCLSALLPGCEPKEDLVQTEGQLEFAADTVLFDTVFTTVRTVTKRLWVYNRNGKAIKTDVSLAGLQGTTYSLIIGGDAQPAASGVLIRGNDSLLVLVRATLGDNGTATAPKDFLVTDQINFLTNGNAQSVKLVAYGQNAYFHRADIITANTTWRNDKPHVIINANYTSGGSTYLVGVAVAQGTTLRIPKGTRIYSHAGATIQVDGTLLVNDLSEPAAFVPTDTVAATNANLVRFAGDRLESFYNDIPGQWGGIVFTPTSHGSRIRYAEIKNATYGLLLLNPDNVQPHPSVAVDNTTIKNISGAGVSFAAASQLPFSLGTGGGIISVSGDVAATNSLFTNCGEYAVLGYGGVYDLNFCTVANYTPSFRRTTASLTFTNKPLSGSGTLPVQATVRNSIVWGSITDELEFVGNADYRATLSVHNSVLRTQLYLGTSLAATTAPGLADASLHNVVNTDPLFQNYFSTSYDYTLKDASPALKLGSATGAPGHDLRNLPRSATPTAGAYEHK